MAVLGLANGGFIRLNSSETPAEVFPCIVAGRFGRVSSRTTLNSLLFNGRNNPRDFFPSPARVSSFSARWKLRVKFLVGGSPYREECAGS